MIGLPSGQVSMEDYTGEWIEAFDEERDRLVAALGPLALAIQHVGSTSVPGLPSPLGLALGVHKLKGIVSHNEANSAEV